MSELNKQSTPASDWQNAKQDKNSRTYTYKIDRENIVEDYRSLRQKQQQFLAKINMSVEMKRELFGFPDSYYCQNTEAAENLVVQNNPFQGKLVIDEKKWLDNEWKRAHQKEEKKKNQNSYAQLDIELQKNSEKLLSEDILIEQKPSSQNVQKLLGRLLVEEEGNGTSISSIEPKRMKGFDSKDNLKNMMK